MALHPVDSVLVADAVRRGQRSVLLSVATNRYIGGGTLIAPDARLDDGELDILSVSPLGRLRFLLLFPRVFRGAHAGCRSCGWSGPGASGSRPAAGSSHTVTGNVWGPLQLDVEVVPGVLAVLAP